MLVLHSSVLITGMSTFCRESECIGLEARHRTESKANSALHRLWRIRIPPVQIQRGPATEELDNWRIQAINQAIVLTIFRFKSIWYRPTLTTKDEFLWATYYYTDDIDTYKFVPNHWECIQFQQTDWSCLAEESTERHWFPLWKAGREWWWQCHRGLLTFQNYTCSSRAIKTSMAIIILPLYKA